MRKREIPQFILERIFWRRSQTERSPSAAFVRLAYSLKMQDEVHARLKRRAHGRLKLSESSLARIAQCNKPLTVPAAVTAREASAVARLLGSSSEYEACSPCTSAPPTIVLYK